MAKTRVTNRLRELRFHASEMTQQQLADRIGVSRQTVMAIEKARYSPSLELAFRIAAVFGLPLEEVFAYDAPQERADGPATAKEHSASR